MSLDMEERPRTPIDSRTDASMRTARGLGKLQALLEKECEAQVENRLRGSGCVETHGRLGGFLKHWLDL